jgi:hypothetical protein
LNIVTSKFREVLLSVAPVVGFVLFLHFTLTPLEPVLLGRFLVGAIALLVGFTIFLIGVDIGVTPLSTTIGSHIARSNKMWVLVVAGLVLGFLIAFAEPVIHVLGGQVESVTSGVIPKNQLVIVVSLGVGLMLVLGLARIVKNLPLNRVLTGIYVVVFIIASFVSPEFLAMSFDSMAAITGAFTIPFLLGLGLGVSRLKKDSKASEEDSFGLIGVTATGAVICVMLMSAIYRTESFTGSLEQAGLASDSVLRPFLVALPGTIRDAFVALAPIVGIFLIFQRISFKLSSKAVRRIMFGMLFTFVGLVLFLLGVNVGFMDVGSMVGYLLAENYRSWVLVLGFALGLLITLAEPAVHVLTAQVEEVTSGYVKRGSVMFTLGIGVALAMALSMIRILVPGLQLWHFLLAGYLISIIMSYITPGLFVGMAFDSGGVASGPMVATFTLAFAQGVAEAVPTANVLVDGFGVIAMVAMTPLIAIQVLGLVFEAKSKKRGVEASEG